MKAEHRYTDDGRYIVVDGRRWRATDPRIPPDLKNELVAELMRARRLINSEGDAARPLVHEAKIALGERGEPWWEPTDEGRRRRAEAVINALLRARGGEPVCAPEVASVIGGTESGVHLSLVEAVIHERNGEQAWSVCRSSESLCVRGPSNAGDG
ncbi:hypothetical protein ACUXNS_002905 [Brevibacterium pityocampae]